MKEGLERGKALAPLRIENSSLFGT